MALATVDETAKVIQSIRFTLLSPTELRKISAVEYRPQTPTTRTECPSSQV